MASGRNPGLTRNKRNQTIGIGMKEKKKIRLRLCAHQLISSSVLTHLTSWFVRGNHLFDETQLGGRDAPDQEDKEQRVVTWVWTGHLMAEEDMMIGQCINSQ